MKRILITGSRNWTDWDRMNRALAEAWKGLGEGPIVLIHGAARGADTMAAQIWTSRGLPVEVHPADWDRYGRAAGIKRNEEMVWSGADLCLAFPLGESRGTRHCIGFAQKAGIPVAIYEG